MIVKDVEISKFIDTTEKHTDIPQYQIDVDLTTYVRWDLIKFGHEINTNKDLITWKQTDSLLRKPRGRVGS